VTSMPSHVDDGAAESCWQWCCRGDFTVTRCRCQVILATMLSSHAGDDATGVTWSWSDVNVESCWRQCYRVKLTTTLLGQLDRDVM
jgi:hypothetical protein